MGRFAISTSSLSTAMFDTSYTCRYIRVQISDLTILESVDVR